MLEPEVFLLDLPHLPLLLHINGGQDVAQLPLVHIFKCIRLLLLRVVVQQAQFSSKLGDETMQGLEMEIFND